MMIIVYIVLGKSIFIFMFICRQMIDFVGQSEADNQLSVCHSDLTPKSWYFFLEMLILALLEKCFRDA